MNSPGIYHVIVHAEVAFEVWALNAADASEHACNGVREALSDEGYRDDEILSVTVPHAAHE